MHKSTVPFRIRIVVAVVTFVAVSAICPKAYGVINVLDYGATGNGLADDTAALQAAIDAGIATYQSVYIPFGYYRITAPLDISIGSYGLFPLQISSDWGTLLADASMESVLNVNTAAWLTLERLRIDANNQATYGAKFYKISGVQSMVQQVYVTGAQSHGFYFDKCQVSVFDRLVSSQNGGDGFYLLDSNGATLRDSDALANGGNGFTVTASDFSGGVKIRGGRAEVNNGHGIHVVDSTSPTVLSDMWVESNVLDGVRIGTRDVGVHGLSVTGHGTGSNYAIHLVSGAEGANVTGNYVQRSSGPTDYASIHLDPGVSSTNIGFANFNRYSGAPLPAFGNLQLPDETPTFSHIEGNATFASDNVLTIELGGTTPGTEYDTLHVDGTLTLNGTLDVVLLNGFEPSLGDTFDILDFGSRSGGFSEINLPSLAANLDWDMSVLYIGGQISVIFAPSEPVLGDFDEDWDVDAFDFADWQANFPTASGAALAMGDADGDGDVDAFDFADWQANYPYPPPPEPTPEPATMGLLLIGGLALLRRRY